MRTVLILGAGFSYPLGLPLASGVIPWLWKHLETDVDSIDAESKIETDFWIKQANECRMISEQFDFESFLAFLYSIAPVWSKMRDKHSHAKPHNWSEYLNWPPNPKSCAEDLQSRFLNQISRFHSAHCGEWDAFKPAINLFTKLLRPGDSILTFNFDSVAETSIYWAFGREKSSHGIRNADRISVYHLHGCAEWKIYELPNGKDDDPESTIEIMQHANKIWKLRKTGGEFDLSPYQSYAKLGDAAVQMVPFKSVPWFLLPQWEQALEELKHAQNVIVIGYSFPAHDSVARFAIRSALLKNANVKVINIDPKAHEPEHQRTMTAILGQYIEFIPENWC